MMKYDAYIEDLNMKSYRKHSKKLVVAIKTRKGISSLDFYLTQLEK